ncbi:hypothetical protein EDB89DRAFT_2077337 [Lactarius sanguifluus]|nr:hypothetical protein EDB89DRAFT_2077337 [Lactarius sanguifluus]
MSHQLEHKPGLTTTTQPLTATTPPTATVGVLSGQFNGYVPAGHRILDTKTGTRDRVEIYNIPKFNGDFKHNHPQLIQNNIEEIEQFTRLLHSEVLDPLHILLAIALELPEDYFCNMHKYGVKSEDHLRYMKYTKFTPEENTAIGYWSHAHTDLGSFTLLFRQPVAALQIHDPIHNEWKWVKPQDATLTMNVCNAMSFLTGSYVRSTIHCVTAQPGRSLHEDPKYAQDDPRWDREVRGATAVLERLLESWEKAPRAEDHVRVGRAVSTRDPYPPSRDYQEAWD